VSFNERQADRLVVGVAGEIDHGSADAFLEAVVALRAEGDRHLVLDLSECSFCDSAGIRVLTRLVRQTRDHGGRLLLAAPRRSLARTVEMAGLSDVLPHHPTVSEALAQLEG
jgi:anti-sigma B factor antagonist